MTGSPTAVAPQAVKINLVVTVSAAVSDGSNLETVVGSAWLQEGWQTYTEKRGHMFKLNASFDEAADRIKDYDGLVVIG